MPQLSEITYSRDAVVAAVQDYYAFLTKMYLKESAIIQPPQGGWPSITSDSLRDLGKTNDVVSLLRHLPYIGEPNQGRDRAQGAPDCYFADWQDHVNDLKNDQRSGEDLKVITEGPDISNSVPAQVIGLTNSGGKSDVFLLDTELGIVHWVECPGEVRYDPSREEVEDDPYDYVEDEEEAEWRGDAPAWTIADFFELLKDQYRKLRFVPVSPRIVEDIYTKRTSEGDEMIAIVQELYREHGWPDLARYRKDECLAAIQTALEEQYPDSSDWRDDD